MSFILDGTTLEDPNDFSQEKVVTGDYLTTMGGGIRRAIRAKKNVYKLGWNQLTLTQYNTLVTKYNLNTTLTFVNSDLSINTTVHIDMDNRRILPGFPDYLSSVSITLREI